MRLVPAQASSHSIKAAAHATSTRMHQAEHEQQPLAHAASLQLHVPSFSGPSSHHTKFPATTLQALVMLRLTTTARTTGTHTSNVLRKLQGH